MAAKKAVDVVGDYLKKANRPFSVNDIVSKLDKQYGKSAVTKALEVLVEKGDIREKQNHKNKVYFFNQELINASEADLAAVEQEIREAENEVRSAQDEVSTIQHELAQYSGKPVSLEEITAEFKAISEKLKEINAEIKSLKSQAGDDDEDVSMEQLKEWTSKKEKYEKEWRKRKRIAMDMIEGVLENYPKTKKQLLEDVGVETDEIVGVFL